MAATIGQLTQYIAVLEERVKQLEVRCDKKDSKIEALQAFQNKAIGYSMLAGTLAAVSVPMVSRFVGH